MVSSNHTGLHRARLRARDGMLTKIAVKFDTAKLPPILNALQTDNNGQKLVLEVSVGPLETPSIA
jgi:hypothetical protein